MVGIDQSERTKSSGKYASLFGYFANFTPKFDPVALYISHDVEMEATFWWERTRSGYVLLRFFSRNATCSGLISSHDSPPPPGAGNGRRRRTCLREMCWLKSIEVEDKKIMWRQVSLYLGIYHFFCFIWYSRFFFFMSYFGNIYLFFSFEKNTFISNICFMLFKLSKPSSNI